MPKRWIHRLLCACVVVIAGGTSGGAADLTHSVSSLAWLSGAWSGTSNGLFMEEHWMQPLGATLVGMHRDVKDGRTTSFEFFRIEEQQGRLVYLASPRGAAPTPFTATEVLSERVVFENTAHDFPQRIIYWREGDVLHARVEGTVRGKLQAEEWAWRLTH